TKEYKVLAVHSNAGDLLYRLPNGLPEKFAAAELIVAGNILVTAGSSRVRPAGGQYFSLLKPTFPKNLYLPLPVFHLSTSRHETYRTTTP
ncbi:MAG: hypothetical protein ABIQ93_14800, partial [Saprospiraceae bacterium]